MNKSHNIHKVNRLQLLILAILILVSVKLPLWRIDLSAPQYPEGLKLMIYPGHLGGDVEIISGLNHYIGMRSLHTEDFYEFKILPTIFIVISFLFVCVAIANRRRLLFALLLVVVAFGIVAMIDFWKWEYDYGHNLNPEAPIIVPGMAYQPPLIGFKQLLNFGAYSIPAIGGWLFVGAGFALLLMNIVELRWARKARLIGKEFPLAAILIFVVLMNVSCSNSPSPIIIGKDMCSFCKMPVSDNRFGGELITTRGKIYKFDDAGCMLSFLKSEEIKIEGQNSIYAVDFSGSHLLIPVSNSKFLKSEALKSPMNGNIAAFANADSLQSSLEKFPGKILDWEDLIR